MLRILSFCVALCYLQVASAQVPIRLFMLGGNASPAQQINWNPGYYLLTYNQPVGNGNTTYTGSAAATDMSNAYAAAPTIKGYAFWGVWSFFEGGSSGTQGDYSNVQNNGTSYMAQLMADAASKGMHIIVQFNPNIFNGGSPLTVPTDGAYIPAYILTNSTYGAAEVGSSGATPQSPYSYGWYTQQTGAFSANWQNANVQSAMLAAIENFATQWDGNPYLEAFCLDDDSDMYPYDGTGLQGDAYYETLTTIMEAIKSYFKHTNVCLQAEWDGNSAAAQQMAQTLVEDGVLMSGSDTMGATAWSDTVWSVSFSSLSGSTGVLNGAPYGYGNVYTCAFSTGQSSQMTTDTSGSEDVTFSPTLTGSPSLSATCNFAWPELGASQMAWGGIQAGGSSWTPPSPALQTYSTSIMFAEEGDFSGGLAPGTVYLPNSGFTTADMIQAMNDDVTGGVGHHGSHLLISYGDSTVWGPRLSDAEATALTNISYPSVYGGSSQAATPSFSPAGGTYSSTQTVTLSDATSGATIYYTENGSTPTTSSPVYSSALTISSTTTVKAIATASGYTQSNVGSATYTISGGGTIRVVQAVPISPTGDVASVSGTISGVTAGDAIIVVVNYLDNNCGTPASVNDGSAYTDDFNSGTPRDQSVTSWSLFNAAAGSHTVTISKCSSATTADAYYSAEIYELSGVPTTDSYDTASAGASGASTGPLTVTTGTLANSGDIVLGSAFENATVTGLANPSGWTNQEIYSSNYPSSVFSYILPGSTSALSPSFGTTSTSGNWSVGAVAYEP